MFKNNEITKIGAVRCRISFQAYPGMDALMKISNFHMDLLKNWRVLWMVFMRKQAYSNIS